MDVLLCGDFDHAERERWLRALAAAMPEARWLDRDEAARSPQSTRAAVVANPPAAALAGLPKLTLIQSLWAGVERLLADDTLPQGVPLARMVDPAMNAAMAETALWATLSLQRDFFTYARQQSESRWQQHPQRRADEVRVLVLGQGEMGRTAAAAIARAGFVVSGWSRSGSRAVDGVAQLCGNEALAAALAATDVVINLLPLTAETRGLIDGAFLAALPRGAGIVNLARGAHVVDEALLAALASGQIGHAVLDVFATEPLPREHRYWRHPRVTVLPHTAAQTDPRTAAAVAAANLRAARDGLPIAHLVERRRGY